MKKVFSISLTVFLIFLFCGQAIAEEKPILIAAPVPLTGPYASDGVLMKQSLEMAVDDYNAKGGVLNRKLELIFGDIAAGEPEKIKAVGERLVAKNPDLIITGYDNGGVFVFGEYDIPYMHESAMSELVDPVAKNLDKYWNCFHYVFTEEAYGLAAFNQFVKKAPEMMNWNPPNKKIAVVAVDFSYSTRAAEYFVKLAQKAGYEIVLNEIINFGTADYGPILSKIESKEPAFIAMFHIVPDDPARFMTQFADLLGDDGYDGLLWMQYVPDMPEFAELAGKSAEGLLFAAGPLNVTAEGRAFNNRWAKRYGSQPPSILPSFLRDAFDLWAAAVTRAGCSDCYRDVRTQMLEYPHRGMEGHLIVFNPLTQSAIYGEGFIPLTLLQYQAGKKVSLLPKQNKKGDIRRPPWMKK
jgi:branched-chain amino acid transport system substrate-binding protein